MRPKNLIDPKEFGLPSKTLIEKKGAHHYVLHISRKSRVIMTDGKKILQKWDCVKKAHPKAKFSVNIQAPLCSKTCQFLEAHGIGVTHSI